MSFAAAQDMPPNEVAYAPLDSTVYGHRSNACGIRRRALVEPAAKPSEGVSEELLFCTYSKLNFALPCKAKLSRFTR